MPSTTVTREVYYSQEQMYSLVADVESYPAFVPSWQAVRVRNRKEDSYITDQVVRLGPVRHTFSTRTRLVAPSVIEVTSSDPPFRSFRLNWSFETAEDGGCRITLVSEFELRIRAFQIIGSLLSSDSIHRMISAFETRARALYGPPGAESHA
ncbi:type II toxin-antitoxin system RatA family toxin [Novispirillum itersonii]|uniref:type II toxin-antitoxin system RatA family toxin n=1 Tax=Novispirillum itersonii TaxID=189 RepID=UPI00035E035F|nr:type II toxin-antitoxin system RatA family toxin [Novispirillum itersonii]